MTATGTGNVNEPTNLKGCDKSRGGSVSRAITPAYLQTRSSQAPRGIIAVPNGELVVQKPFEQVHELVGEDARPVVNEEH